MKKINNIESFKNSQYIHAIKRAKERFGLDLSRNDIDDLIDKIKNGKSIITFRQSMFESNHIIFFKDYYMLVGFNLMTDKITTFLRINHNKESHKMIINLIIAKHSKKLINVFNKDIDLIKSFVAEWKDMNYENDNFYLINFLSKVEHKDISNMALSLIKEANRLIIFLNKSFNLSKKTFYKILDEILYEEFKHIAIDRVAQIQEEAKKVRINKLDFSNIELT